MVMDFTFLEGYGVELTELVEKLAIKNENKNIYDTVFGCLQTQAPKNEGLAFASLDEGLYVYAYMLSPLKTKDATFWEEYELKEAITEEILNALGLYAEAAEIRIFVENNFKYHLVPIYV